MPISGVSISRVSNLLVSDTMQSQIQNNEQQLFNIENELSTGKMINSPSDNPGSAAIVIQLQNTLNQRGTYNTNLTSASSQLSEVDSTLGDLNTLVQQAISTASANVSSTVSASARAAAGQVVQSISSQVLSIANKQFNGQYLFGGDKATTAPFVSTGNGIQFVGSTTVTHNQIDDGVKMPTSVSAAQVFGALSSSVTGSANLPPRLQTSTPISSLTGTTGNGVQLGTILLGNGVTTKQVDLSNASTLGDVMADINNAGLGNIAATLSASGAGLQLQTTGTDNITVQDVGGGTTARDLGILKATGNGAGQPLVGSSPQPAITLLTPLADLRGGAGIDTVHGLKITNGGQTATVDLSHANTVEDLINSINGSGIGVSASVNAAGTSINIQNATQGTTMTISENGGTTAADLGVRSFTPSTLLSQLNGGSGVRTVTGADFQITNSAGASFPVDLGSGQQTVQDVITAINSAATAAGVAGVTASFSSTSNGIVLSDTAGGGGALTVTPLNFSSAAADLGLTVPASGGTITGADVNGVADNGLFSDLAALQKALQNNDQAGITAAGAALQADQTRIINTNGSVGAMVQEVNSRQTRMSSENLATQSLMSTLQDTDFTTAVTQYQQMQNALQATLEMAAKSQSLSLVNFLG